MLDFVHMLEGKVLSMQTGPVATSIRGVGQVKETFQALSVRELSDVRAHVIQLRAPLFTVLAAVEQRSLKLSRSEARALHSSARQLLDLTHELSKNSQKDSVVPVSSSPVNLATYCRELVAEISSTLAKKRMRFTYSVPGDLTVRIQRVHVAEVIRNLISNAWKYSPAGSSIEMRISKAAHGIQIEVADEGLGVAAADQERIFEAFERGAHVTEISGSGLGLATVRRIARQYGGNAWVEARYPRGSIFRVTMQEAV